MWSSTSGTAVGRMSYGDLEGSRFEHDGSGAGKAIIARKGGMSARARRFVRVLIVRVGPVASRSIWPWADRRDWTRIIESAGMYRSGHLVVPELVAPVMEFGVVGARRNEGWLRSSRRAEEFTIDRHRTVDDRRTAADREWCEI